MILEHHFRFIVGQWWSSYIVGIEVVEGCLWCMEKSEGGWEGKLKGKIKNETTRLSAGIWQSQEIQNEGINIFNTQMRKLQRKATNKLQYLYKFLTSFQAMNNKQYGSWNECFNWEGYGRMIDTDIESKIKEIRKCWTDIPTNFHHMPTTATHELLAHTKNQAPIFRFIQKRIRYKLNISINEGDSGRVKKRWW